MNDARAALEQGDRIGALAAVNAALALDPEYLAAQALKERVERTPLGPRWTQQNRSSLRDATSDSVPPVKRNLTEPPPEPPIVSAEGWARFEQRARSRRLDRRVAAARLAISRRRFAEAREVLHEISEIDPGHPDLISLGIELDAAEHSSRAWSRRWGPAIAAGLIFAAVLSGARILQSPEPRPAVSPLSPVAEAPVATDLAAQTPPSTSAEPSVPTTPPEINQSTVADAGIPAAAGSPAADTGITAPVAAPASPSAPLPRAQSGFVPRDVERASSVPEPAAATPLPTTGRVEAAPTAAATPTAPPPPASSVAPAVTPPPSLAPAVTPAALPGNVAPEPAETLSARVVPRDEPEPTRPSAAVPTAVISAPRDEDLVRRTLQQYRVAYESLDARSAQAVWPRVDEPALQRAFAGLESQRLTFDDCQVQVRGTVGVATCRGTTLYVPKVGNRDPHREPRVWTFDLRKVGESWQIDSARAAR